MTHSAIAYRRGQDPVHAFRQLALRYSELLGEEGVKSVPFHSEELPHFSALEAAAQQEALHALAGAVEVFEAVRQEGGKLRDNKRLLWRSLHHLGMVPESDIFGLIGDDDVVEIYSLEQKHLFWNLRLMELVSFTVEQLYSTAWWIMGKRTPNVDPLLMEAAQGFLSGRIQHTIDPQIPEHLLEEVGTESRYRFVIRLRYLSPVRRNGELAGILSVNTPSFAGSAWR